MPDSTVHALRLINSVQKISRNPTLCTDDVRDRDIEESEIRVLLPSFPPTQRIIKGPQIRTRVPATPTAYKSLKGTMSRPISVMQA